MRSFSLGIAITLCACGGASPPVADAETCRNAGTDVLDLQGFGSDAPIHLGAYISDDQTDVIGIRPPGER